jgi:hypothetical protein
MLLWPFVVAVICDKTDGYLLLALQNHPHKSKLKPTTTTESRIMHQVSAVIQAFLKLKKDVSLV